MVSPKYVTKMIPFWQKVWILLKQLLLLFWKICLLRTNLSRPQASSQAKPALPRGHLSIRTISSVRNGLLPLLPAQVLEELPCGRGWNFTSFAGLLDTSHLLSGKGRRKLARPRRASLFFFFPCSKSAIKAGVCLLGCLLVIFFSFLLVLLLIWAMMQANFSKPSQAEMLLQYMY